MAIEKHSRSKNDRLWSSSHWLLLCHYKMCRASCTGQKKQVALRSWCLSYKQVLFVLLTVLSMNRTSRKVNSPIAAAARVRHKHTYTPVACKGMRAKAGLQVPDLDGSVRTCSRNIPGDKRVQETRRMSREKRRFRPDGRVYNSASACPGALILCWHTCQQVSYNARSGRFVNAGIDQ